MGCEALYRLTYAFEPAPTSAWMHHKKMLEVRINNIIDAGAFRAIAAAVRSNPVFSVFGDEKSNLESSKNVMALLMRLVGDKDMKDIMAPEDHMTLFGTKR